MSDRLPNPYSTFPNNFPQGPPAQQAQHHPPQQPQRVGSQSPQVGISHEMREQMQFRHQQQQQLQQPQPQPQPQQQQQPAGELMQEGLDLSLSQQQVCLAPVTHPFVVPVKSSVTSTYILI